MHLSSQKAKLIERLERNSMRIPIAGCWVWLKATDRDGYGKTSLNIGGSNKTIRAHRLSYELHRGEIPDGLQLDHLCRNPSCINPAHLEPVTCKENVRRGLVGEVTSRRFAAMTHCKRGHEFTTENTRIDTDGHRVCRECQRMHIKAFKQKKLNGNNLSPTSP